MELVNEISQGTMGQAVSSLQFEYLGKTICKRRKWEGDKVKVHLRMVGGWNWLRIVLNGGCGIIKLRVQLPHC
jgi:hypothetical protein